MIEPPNIEHKPTHNTFQYVPHPLTKLNNFYLIDLPLPLHLTNIKF